MEDHHSDKSITRDFRCYSRMNLDPCVALVEVDCKLLWKKNLTKSKKKNPLFFSFWFSSSFFSGSACSSSSLCIHWFPPVAPPGESRRNKTRKERVVKCLHLMSSTRSLRVIRWRQECRSSGLKQTKGVCLLQ